jgi:hypothetical protein
MCLGEPRDAYAFLRMRITLDHELPTPIPYSTAFSMPASFLEDQCRMSRRRLLHNHPSGDPKPSRDDIEMTREVKAAAEALGIAIHDHLVIGRKGHASFRSLGLI